MEQNHIAVGLDIGTTKIVAMIGRLNEYGKMEVLGIGKSKSLGVHRGVVNNITKTIQSIQQAVEQAESISTLKIENVTVGIAGQHIHSRQHPDYIVRPNPEEVIDINDINKLCEQVYKLVMMPGEEILHVLPQEYKIDGQSDITEPIGMYGGRLEANFHLVIGKITSIKNIGRCVKSAGLGLSGVTLEPLASAAAVLSKEEKEAGVALIDIGGGTTDLAIFKDDIIRHTAVIPIGGNSVTEDIKEGCSIIEKQAELLKVKFGSAWPGENSELEMVSIEGLRGRPPKEISLKNLSKIIHARMQEITELVYEEIKKYDHLNSKKQLIAGIVLTGGGSELKHLKQLVQFITGMDTRIGYPNEHLAGNQDKEITSPMYATAVGLVMNNLEIQKQEVALQSKEEKEAEAGESLAEKPQNEAPQAQVKTEVTEEVQKQNDKEEELKNKENSEAEKRAKVSKKWSLKNLADRIKDFLDNAE